MFTGACDWLNMNKRSWKNIFFRFLFSQKGLALVGLVILILVFFPLAKNIKQRQKIDKEIQELEAEIKSIENKNSGLKEMIEYLESDRFLEEQARLNFGLKKSGENVAVVELEGEKGSASSAELSNQPIFDTAGIRKQKQTELNNPARWWSYFFN